MLRLNDLVAVCVQNLELVILLLLSPLPSESENEIKSIKIVPLILELFHTYQAFKRLGFLISFTKIYKVCINVCIIYVLQDSCNLDDNRGVGV